MKDRPIRRVGNGGGIALSATSKTILIVDDEPKIRLMLRRCLESDGFNVLETDCGSGVERIIASGDVDLITLDLQLGPENGLEIAAKLRATSTIPIIMVTGRGDVIDKVVGLEMGADDYISKPFHLREVLARIHSVLRRSDKTAELKAISLSQATSPQSDLIKQFDGWQSNLSTFELTDPEGNSCDLTTADFKLLTVFLKNPKRVLSRDQIMDQVNGIDWTPNDRTIDNQVARLRKRIEEDPANPKIIKTIRGVGYMFATNVNDACSQLA